MVATGPVTPGVDPDEAAGREATPRVLMVTPHSLESNPYVRLLLGALRAGGASIELAKGRSAVLLWRALMRHGVPDVVHLQWHNPYVMADRLHDAVRRTFLFLLQILTFRVLGARVVWTVHNLVEHERRHVRWELLACRLLARSVHALIVHCETAAREVASAYRVREHRLHVVPHGILEGSGAGDRAEARRELELDDDQTFLLHFGRIREYKGIGPLIDAFRRVDAPRSRLAIVGFPDDPELAEALRRRAGDDPRIGFRFETVADDELSQLIRAADAVVLPYQAGLTSGAAILAAAHARPVIIPRLGCLEEFPPDAAILYAAAEEGGLAAALEEAQNAPLQEMGRAARAFVERVPWTRVAELTMAAYGHPGARAPEPRPGL